MGDADPMTCPECGSALSAKVVGTVHLRQCEGCRGVFLRRGDLADLVEAENDWHSLRSTDTARLPRITADMTAPPPAPKARAWVESLFV
jgi:Zn-finger nucleic acid-binding protein